MAQTPFIGEISMVGFNFPPVGWAFCNGQLLSISQNTALFSLLGTTYGGNGTTNFALPDFRSRVPIHLGQGSGLSNYQLGESGGSESVTLTSNQIPSHNHSVACQSAGGNQSSPGLHFPASDGTGNALPYSTTADSTMAPTAVGTTGGGQSHTNVQPFLTCNFIIALTGVFPSRN